MKKMGNSKRYLTTEERRSALKLVYKNDDWPGKVDRMSNKQVYAIFDKFRKCGRISYDDYGNMIFRNDEEVKKLQEERSGVHQLTLDEYLKQKEFDERKKAQEAKNILKGDNK